jgi:ABC-type Fe3+-siderophore transport system permease subunit
VTTGRGGRALAVLWLLLPGSIVAAVCLGATHLPAAGVLASIGARIGLPAFAALSPPEETILFAVRVPRALLAALVGGGLAVVGACLQSVFRNPLADSGLLGVGAGAAFGAVLAVRFGLAGVFLALPLAAFAGSMAAVGLVYLLSHARGRPSLQGLLLTGIAVSAFAAAATSVLLVSTEEFRVKVVLFWLAGGLEGRGWDHLRGVAALILGGCAGLWLLARTLDVLSLGDDEAASLGVRVHVARIATLTLAALVAGAATAVAGSVPFVGLVAPHALRPLVGSAARRLLPAAFAGGAILVVLADLASRTASARFELPLGSVTALVGAPYFLLALRAAAGRE